MKKGRGRYDVEKGLASDIEGMDNRWGSGERVVAGETAV